MENFIIETERLSKTFNCKIKGKNREVVAVKEINLSVKKGEIFGFLGPNGAGKSTTQKILSTLLPPTQGRVYIAGYDLAKNQNNIRQNIGYVSQAGGSDDYATGRENLILQARLYGMSYTSAKKNASEQVERLQMRSFIDRLAITYSGGQKRRLDIALGMIHRPRLLLLDEPTTGLDPQSRAYLWEEIKKLKLDDISIFLTTHYLDEADKLCDTIAIIDNGVIITQGTPEELKKAVGADMLKFSFATKSIAQEAEKLIKIKVSPLEIKATDNFLHLFMQNGEKALPALLRLFDKANLTAQTVMLTNRSLDDVFLKFTGHSLREDK